MASKFSTPGFKNSTKDIENLLTKDFPAGTVSLNAQTTASNGVKFIVNGSQKTAEGTINSSLKMLHSSKARGTTTSLTWGQPNVLGICCTFDNAFLRGAKLNVDTSLDLSADNTKHIIPGRPLRIGLEYSNPSISTFYSANLEDSSNISGDFVVGKNNFIAGVSLMYDITKADISSRSFLFGFYSPEWTVIMKNQQDLGGKYSLLGLHRVNRNVEMGWKAQTKVLNPQKTSLHLELAAKYTIDKDTSFKAKVDSDGILSLSLGLTIREGIQATVGGVFNSSKLDKTVHKLGASISLQA